MKRRSLEEKSLRLFLWQMNSIYLHYEESSYHRQL